MIEGKDNKIGSKIKVKHLKKSYFKKKKVPHSAHTAIKSHKKNTFSLDKNSLHYKTSKPKKSSKTKKMFTAGRFQLELLD